MPKDRTERLKNLQDEIIRLKTSIPEIKLSKTKVGIHAPFPIKISALVAGPSQNASQTESITLELVVTSKHEDNAEFDIDIHIESNSMSSALKTKIATKLKHVYHNEIAVQNKKDDTSLHLLHIFNYMKSNYAHLISLTGNDTGASTPAAALLRAEQQSVSRILSELRHTRRRFSTTMMNTSTPTSTSSPSSSVEMQMEQLALEDVSFPLIFKACISPTDPMWISLKYSRQYTLDIICTIKNREYPKSGTFSVCIDPKCPFLSPQERIAFDNLLNIEAVAATGRPQAILNVLRRCENQGGEIFYQAIDIALEVERRRRKQQQEAEAAAADIFKSTQYDSSDGSFDEYSHDDSTTGSNSRSDSRSRSNSRSSDSESEQETDNLQEDNNAFKDDDDYDDGIHSGDDAIPNKKKSQNSRKHRRTTNKQGSHQHKRIKFSFLLQLDALQLVGIDTLDMVKLHIQFACHRCHAANDTSFEGGGTLKRKIEKIEECPTCHIAWHISLAARIAHEQSNVVASIISEGCSPVDLLPSSIVAAQCESCSNVSAFRNVGLGVWNERQCSTCHRKLAFHAQQAVYTKNERSSITSSGVSTSLEADGNNNSAHRTVDKNRVHDAHVVIVPGQQLPHRGTCKHYLHSYRWLRFPCCGMRYPCDLCHEEASHDGHEMKWAHRMVCGYCSTEQAVAQSCAACEKRLTSTASRPTMRNTKFWEGGEGQRDLRRLSKNDPHKRRGRYKTKSKKDERVGEKGKEKREHHQRH